MNNKETSQSRKCYATRAKESGIKSLAIIKCKAKQLLVEFRTTCLSNLFKKAKAAIQTSFEGIKVVSNCLYHFKLYDFAVLDSFLLVRDALYRMPYIRWAPKTES